MRGNVEKQLSTSKKKGKIILIFNQDRPGGGGVVVYQYTRKKIAKIPKNTRIPYTQKPWPTLFNAYYFSLELGPVIGVKLRR